MIEFLGVIIINWSHRKEARAVAPVEGNTNKSTSCINETMGSDKKRDDLEISDGESLESGSDQDEAATKTKKKVKPVAKKKQPAVPKKHPPKKHPPKKHPQKKHPPKKHPPKKHPPKKPKSIPNIDDDDAWEDDDSSDDSYSSVEEPPTKTKRKTTKPENMDDTRWEELKEQFLDFSNHRLLPGETVRKEDIVECFQDYRDLKRRQFRKNGLCGEPASKEEMDELFEDIHGPAASQEEIESVFADFYERKVRLEVTPDGVYSGLHVNPKFVKEFSESSTKPKKSDSKSDSEKPIKSKKKPAKEADEKKSTRIKSKAAAEGEDAEEEPKKTKSKSKTKSRSKSRDKSSSKEKKKKTRDSSRSLGSKKSGEKDGEKIKKKKKEKQ